MRICGPAAGRFRRFLTGFPVSCEGDPGGIPALLDLLPQPQHYSVGATTEGVASLVIRVLSRVLRRLRRVMSKV